MAILDSMGSVFTLLVRFTWHMQCQPDYVSCGCFVLLRLVLTALMPAQRIIDIIFLSSRPVLKKSSSLMIQSQSNLVDTFP